MPVALIFVIARLAERAVAIQLDCFVAPLLAMTGNEQRGRIVDPALLLWRRYGRASSSAALGTGGGNN